MAAHELSSTMKYECSIKKSPYLECLMQLSFTPGLKSNSCAQTIPKTLYHSNISIIRLKYIFTREIYPHWNSAAISRRELSNSELPFLIVVKCV